MVLPMDLAEQVVQQQIILPFMVAVHGCAAMMDGICSDQMAM
jgi:hypothetical protein